MRICEKCKKVINDYQPGKYNPNGDYIGVKDKTTNFEWKIKCPYCNNIQEDN